MSIAYPTAETLPLVVPYRPARLSVADYHRLISGGHLAQSNRIELLRGVLVEKMTHNPLHAALIGILQKLIDGVLPAGFCTRTQLPITLRDSEPEPDLAIARGELAEYLMRHPGPDDTQLVVEISASSLVTDRYKAEIYAEAGIPWYWIVNLTARRVEVYSQPAATPEGIRYGEPRIYQPGEMIPVIVADQQVGSIAAEKLLPVVTG
ncbi:Uma2 family endonuclease [Anatilimnocola floriformis]|uniref:Uma2 family endonuclease n=1 Tax=Anatilimnocola floriformis TaxID=2948575 RepID=UPI0020C1F396|nr:Uma2 family endonuclease [Anatilimnocola floriformis]